MPVREPRWWYGAGGTLAEAALAPVSSIWSWAATRRMAAAPQYRAPFPVICVGNLTAGGTGKTPLSILIAETLLAKGLAPVFLSRGYGGAIKGPHRVDAARDSAGAVGDEPLLLARTAPVMIARDRAAGARAIAQTATAQTVVIMDDGLQNPALAKDLTFAVVDGRRGIGNGRVMPAGPLRAPLAVQLAHVDAVIMNVPDVATAAGEPVVARFRTGFQGPVLLASAMPRDTTDWLAGQDVIAFAGIGSPQRFFDLLTRIGAHVVATEIFADHHPFTDADAVRLLAMAQHRHALLVTTEKDLARIAGQPGVRGALAAACRSLPITLAMSESDRDRLGALIEAARDRHARAGS
ncbi:MAG: tetraacyldisaccharide 4'-kinase [Hyphomicrobiaceae bacterium]